VGPVLDFFLFLAVTGFVWLLEEEVFLVLNAQLSAEGLAGVLSIFE
jgi:hypothetical protein